MIWVKGAPGRLFAKQMDVLSCELEMPRSREEEGWSLNVPWQIGSYAAEASANILNHDDVIKWKHFPRYWPFVRGIHLSPVNSPLKGQWRRALLFPLICACIKRLSKESWGWWFETPTCSLWRHRNTIFGSRSHHLVSATPCLGELIIGQINLNKSMYLWKQIRGNKFIPCSNVAILNIKFFI